MNSTLLFSFAICLVLCIPDASRGQATDAPVYKDGDWWRVKVEVVQKQGVSRTGQCNEMYSEYLVRWTSSGVKVYAIEGKAETELDCPSVPRDLLNIEPNSMRWLKFPLALKQSWNFDYQRRITGARQPVSATAHNTVVSWEKVSTSKGELDVFKIERTIGGDQTSLYHVWYSPTTKSIIRFQRRASISDRTVTLVDFNVNQ